MISHHRNTRLLQEGAAGKDAWVAGVRDKGLFMQYCIRERVLYPMGHRKMLKDSKQEINMGRTALSIRDFASREDNEFKGSDTRIESI